MPANDSGLELVLKALHDVNESNRKAIESVNALQLAAAQTKAEHDAAIRSAKESSDRLISTITSIESKISEAQKYIEEKIKSSEKDSDTKISQIEQRLRVVEQGYEASKVIPVVGLNQKVEVLSQKHEGLYGRFAVISGVCGTIASIIISILAKYMLQSNH